MIFHNTKLINLWETAVSLFLFVLLVVFFLAERCRQPLATLRERLHLSARATLLLHFDFESSLALKLSCGLALLFLMPFSVPDHAKISL